MYNIIAKQHYSFKLVEEFVLHFDLKKKKKNRVQRSESF